jgi:hypothetical protein
MDARSHFRQAGDTSTILKSGYVCFEVDAEVLAQGVIVGKDLTIPAQDAYMPHVTIKTGFVGSDDREEELSEYLCDWPDCPNVAEHVLGGVKELGLPLALCQQHATPSHNTSD